MAMTDADWLDEAARYFEKRPTGGEDMAFWANVSNAERRRSIAARLRTPSLPSDGEVEADFYAVWSGTMHIGIWSDKSHAEKARREIEGAHIVALFTAAAKVRANSEGECDHEALNSAVDVLRTLQAQPHRSTQYVLWEAIKDYNERAAERRAALSAQEVK